MPKIPQTITRHATSGYSQNQAAKKARSDKEEQQIEGSVRLKAPTVFEIINREGLEELKRPAASLWWAGVAAGLAITLSVYAEALLHMHLPDKPWRPLVENFGYCVGFIVVIIGRLQLFTENTITAVLPVLADFKRRALMKTLRLWSIVFSANMAGTFAAALVILYAHIVPLEQVEAMNNISKHLVDRDLWAAFGHGIPAGFIIAALVWMLPSAHGFELWVIVLMTYLIALGDLTHVIAGSVEVYLLMLQGLYPIGDGLGFIAAMGLGNIIGGTGLFTVLAYAQIREEIK